MKSAIGDTSLITIVLLLAVMKDNWSRGDAIPMTRRGVGYDDEEPIKKISSPTSRGKLGRKNGQTFFFYIVIKYYYYYYY